MRSAHRLYASPRHYYGLRFRVAILGIRGDRGDMSDVFRGLFAGVLRGVGRSCRAS